MDEGTHDHGLLLALSIVRLGTGIVFLYALFLGFTRHKPIVLNSPTPITSVVVADVQPRRALILTLLIFAAFTYLLDELVVLLYFIYQDRIVSYAYQWRGIELADVLGFLAFSSIAIIGIRKDKRGVDFWMRKRLKVGIFLALLLDIAYLVLMLLSIRIFRKRPSSPGVPERPNEPGLNVPNFLHFLALDVRIVDLLLLIIALFKPSTSYVPAHAPATPSTGLLPAAALVTHGAYGTFSDSSSAPKHAPKSANEGAAAKSGAKAVEGYDASHTAHGAAEGSSSRSVHSQHKHAAAENAHEPLVAADPQVEDVPNPVTDDTEVLVSSYAANAAAHADKERQAEEEGQDVVAKDKGAEQEGTAEQAGATDSPTAFAFPGSSNRDDSSLRGGVTFSPEATDNASTKDGEDGMDKKRRRISSQNFKRIVRKITDIPKRKESISSIGSASKASEGQTTPKKMRMSREDSRMSGEGSMHYGDSPAPSIDGKAKKRRMSLGRLRGASTTSKE